ncbi:MAG: HAD family hydrolase [Lachnospiraceae bacterium]|nr:HAD family hydrolase [Lachnospiraceae bacterium]
MKMKNTDIKMVVSDFDGTLLRSGMMIPSEKFYQVLDDMLERNIGFIAASGRQYPSLRKMLSKVEKDVGFIAENGSLIIWKGEIIHQISIARECAMRLIEDLKKEQDANIYASGVYTGYITSNDKEYTDTLESAGMDIEIISSFQEVKEGMMKITAIYKDGIPEETKERYKRKYGEELCVVDSGNGWLDFMPKESGKGEALKYLAEIAGFSLEETVAFGDQENDITMLKAAKIGYAMDTAYDYVKAAADDTCRVVEDTLWDALYE